MQIKMGDVVIGSCSYNRNNNQLRNIEFDYNGENLITNDTNITITGTLNNSTYTIETNIGNLINGGNLSFTN